MRIESPRISNAVGVVSARNSPTAYPYACAQGLHGNQERILAPARLISGRVACWERLLGRFVDGFLVYFSDFFLRLEPVIKVRAWLIAPLDVQLVGS